MNRKLFETSIPEIYTKVIPKYFTEKRKADRPRLNGYAVSVDEFKEKFPDYTPEEGFIPDMVYAPPELNVARAFSSVADIVDMINNDIVFCIRGSLGKCGFFQYEKGARFRHLLQILNICFIR